MNDTEKDRVVAELCSERFVDLAPAQVSRPCSARSAPTLASSLRRSQRRPTPLWAKTANRTIVGMMNDSPRRTGLGVPGESTEFLDRPEEVERIRRGLTEGPGLVSAPGPRLLVACVTQAAQVDWGRARAPLP